MEIFLALIIIGGFILLLFSITKGNGSKAASEARMFNSDKNKQNSQVIQESPQDNQRSIKTQSAQNKTETENKISFESDPYYKILDILYENTKPLPQGLDNLFGSFGLEDLKMDNSIVEKHIENIVVSQKNMTDKQIERLIKDLTPQQFKELMFLIQQVNNLQIVAHYNELSKKINDRTLVAMRVLAYGISREEAEQQVREFDSNFFGLEK